MRRFKCLGELEEERVLAARGRELHAQWKPGRGAPQRQRDRRRAGSVVERRERSERTHASLWVSYGRSVVRWPSGGAGAATVGETITSYRSSAFA